MKVIGLCGKTGSGKSTVGKYFETLGAAYIDTDSVSREVCSPGNPCLEELARFFGSDILNDDGSLSRKKLAETAMNGGVKYKKLNEITHRHILAATRKFIAKAAKENAKKAVVVDAPLLFESGFNRECDYIIGVISSEAISTIRIKERDGIDSATAEKRLNKQKSNKFLKEHCDFIIENNSTKEELLKKAKAVYDIMGREG
ncbi:MAG: dephospho-CoA kinase [Eubacteriales bacterium]|nr:dephospho-CoA kinase [Eubacteriales bacterium]